MQITTHAGGTYILALVINGKQNDEEIGLKAAHKMLQPESQMLSVSGFIKLNAGETLTVMVNSVKAQVFDVSKSSTFTYHYIGPPNSIPSYLAQVENEMQVKSNEYITPWITDGRAKLFKSLSGYVF